MDKKPLMVVSISAVVLLVMASLTNVVGYQSVKPTVDDSLFFQQSTQKAKMETQDDELDCILDDIRAKLSNAETQEECQRAFQESLLQLEEHGFLGGLRVDDVYKIINDSYASGNSYTVYGESNQTLFIEGIGVLFYELSKTLKFFFGSIFCSFLTSIYLRDNRDHLVHTGSYVTFGHLYYLRGYLLKAYPAIGYIKIFGPNGKTEYNVSFLGQLEHIVEINLGDPELHDDYWIGMKGFKGILIGTLYFGTAKEVGIGITVPDSS